MGNYANSSDLEQRIGSEVYNALCSGSSGAEAILSRAEGMIDGFASVLYEIPLGATPLLQEWTLAIAEYELYKKAPGSDVPEKIKAAYDQTLTRLSELSIGKIGTGGALTLKTGNLPPIIVSAESAYRYE